jgi:hypothetical protein
MDARLGLFLADADVGVARLVDLHDLRRHVPHV